MKIQHKSLKAELLYLIGRATAPLSCIDLYEKCELADEVAQVAKALANLQTDTKIERVPGEGRARYALAQGVSASAPAGKTGRSKAVQADDAAAQAGPITGIRPQAESISPAVEIPVLGDPGTGLNGAAGKAQRGRPAGKPVVQQAALNSEKLADAMLAKLREQLGLQVRELAEISTDAAAPIIHIHIEQVDIHLGGL